MRVADCALALALSLIGCTQVDVVAVRKQGAHAQDASAHADASVHDAAADSGANDAQVTEPACEYRTDAGDATLDQVFAGALTHALCSCAAIAISGRLESDAFDGALGPYTQGELGGDVAANLEMSLDTSSHVLGSLTIAGPSGLSLSPNITLDVGADLAIGGPLEAALADARIAGNAAIAGRIVLASLHVGGELVQPAGSERSVSGTSDIHAQRSASVQVAAPCACGDTERIDSAPIVAGGAMQAVIVQGSTPVLAQRCGHFALANSATTGTLHVTSHASAALYVSGDLQVHGDFIVDTDPGAELDVFIERNATVDGTIALGSKPNQGIVRVFAGGTGTIQLSSGGALHGVLYAPRAELVQSAPLEVTGALFVRRVASTADLTLHYDRSLARR